MSHSVPTVTVILLLMLSHLRNVTSLHVLFLASVLYRDNIQIQRALAEGLLSNGDNVTLIAPISFNHFNRLSFPPGTWFIPLENLSKAQKRKLNGAPGEVFHDVMDYVVESCDIFYEEPLVQRAIELRQLEYDIVIVDVNHNECVLPLLQFTDSTFILLSTNNGIPPYVKYNLAIPSQPSYSQEQWSLNDKLSFTKRMKALFSYRKELFKMHYGYSRSIDKIIYNYIPTHSDLVSSIQDTSLLFKDFNHAIDMPSPTADNVISIGGIQCRKGNYSKLPFDLEEFISESEWGTLYVSFGRIFKSSDIPYSSLVKLVNVFSRVKQRVVWVFDNDKVIQLTDNIRAVSNVSQQDILSHPKVKLFVTHGGHFSRQEAIFHEVPMIVFPLFDPIQFVNAEYIHAKKIGVKFDINAFSEEMLLNGIMEVITNPKYDDNIRILSHRMKDTPLSPLDKALYWIHYTFRHGGNPHLKSYSMHLSTLQYYLIDVVIFVLTSVLLVLYVVVGISLWCYRRYKERRTNNSPDIKGTKFQLKSLQLKEE